MVMIPEEEKPVVNEDVAHTSSFANVSYTSSFAGEELTPSLLGGVVDILPSDEALLEDLPVVSSMVRAGVEARPLPLTVDLAAPDGPLAEVLTQDVPLLMEADMPSADALITLNDDDDNDDGIMDHDREHAPTIAPEDDDLMTFIVRTFEHDLHKGTLELFAGDGLHIFSADGMQELTLPLSVDLANPSGPLAEVLEHDVPLLVEARIPVERTMVELIYSQEGQELARDEVHLMVVQPTVKGGFTRGSVRYSEAIRLSGAWFVFREFHHDRPISVLLPDFLGVIDVPLRHTRTNENPMFAPSFLTPEGWHMCSPAV